MKIDNINTFDIFNGLNNKEIELFLKKINNKSFSKNTIIIKEGDVGGSILFLISGKINITKQQKNQSSSASTAVGLRVAASFLQPLSKDEKKRLIKLELELTSLRGATRQGWREEQKASSGTRAKRSTSQRCTS